MIGFKTNIIKSFDVDNDIPNLYYFVLFDILCVNQLQVYIAFNLSPFIYHRQLIWVIDWNRTLWYNVDDLSYILFLMR